MLPLTLKKRDPDACSYRNGFVQQLSPLILASQSPGRLQLLQGAGIAVVPVPSHIVEPAAASFADAPAAALEIARLKAKAVVQQGRQGYILAADTLGAVAGEILGKPQDRAEALRMLRLISESTHSVFTGWCLLRTSDGAEWSGVERTEITMRRWSDAELNQYLESGEWQGKSGAYGLRREHDPFVIRLIGSTTNVIGLPMERLQEVFQDVARAGAATAAILPFPVEE